MSIKLNKDKLKIYIILGVEFVCIAILLVLIFFAGKKTYTVTFDLNGGTLLSGDLEQRITQGHHANPPSAAKEGHYLRGWAGSYREVTHDVTVTAIWEYETGEGIEYEIDEGKNYCELKSVFKELHGDLYVGAYFNDKKVLSVMDGAFRGCESLTAVYMLDGILTVGEEAFSGMLSLETIDVPSTVRKLGARAFSNCKSLVSITLPRALILGGEAIFEGCTALSSVTLPMEGECELAADSFAGCTALGEIVITSPLLVLKSLDFIPEGVEIKCLFTEEEASEEFLLAMGEREIIYGYSPEAEEEPEGEVDGK